jgi:vesicular inhibitory amino acid transporter
MKNSESDQSFYIDSEEEVDEKKTINEDDDDDSDYSEDNQREKPSSYTTAWPQSYSLLICIVVCHLPVLDF